MQIDNRELLHRIRRAVALQTELWELVLQLGKLTENDFVFVLDWINDQAIISEGEKNVKMADVKCFVEASIMQRTEPTRVM